MLKMNKGTVEDLNSMARANPIPQMIFPRIYHLFIYTATFLLKRR